MANTPIFGWETPDDTDYVYQGAAAARTTANAIDTTMATRVNKAGDTMTGPLVVPTNTVAGRSIGITQDGALNSIIQFLNAGANIQKGYLSLYSDTFASLAITSNGNSININNLGETTRIHNSVTRPMPFAQQAGTLSLGASTAGTVSLAAGRFTQNPLVFITPFQSTGAGVVVTGKVSSVSTSLIEITNTTASPVVFYWQAIQMTSASAAG